MTLKEDAKRWWASKSIWFGNLLIAVGAVVEYLNASGGMLLPYLGHWGGAVMLGIGVLNVLLRLATTKPVARK
jgi:hypothetical protein